MSLYYEAATLITTLGTSQDVSLKSLLFSKTPTKGEQPRKSNPNQLYALITESWKWSSVLRDVIERTGLLSLEKKLSPQLALVLVHDLLLAKKGIAAPESHVLRKAVERHKARLRAEFTKVRIKMGCASVDALRLQLSQQNQGDGARAAATREDDPGGNGTKWLHPRWLRINTLKTRPEKLLKEAFPDWARVSSLEQVLSTQNPGAMGSQIYHVDKHVPNLIALPPGTDLTSIPAYKRGEFISQDKASCFPAYLLSSGDKFTSSILDACAAPGNKTSHISAIVSEQMQDQESENGYGSVKVYATERDLRRAEILKKLLRIADADEVDIKAGQDFFKLDPISEPWNEITAIILDPSCSGSGIVDRGQTMTFSLPSITIPLTHSNGTSNTSKSNRKRKRKDTSLQDKQSADTPIKTEELADLTINENEDDLKISTSSQDAEALRTRLTSLAALQTKMLTFAMSFPKVERITYSTCSVHDIENENVVVAALASESATSGGWRVLRREDQVDGLRAWDRRGEPATCRAAADKLGHVRGLDVGEIAEACIRCEPFTKEGTQGFFVAGFVRDLSATSEATHLSQVTSKQSPTVTKKGVKEVVVLEEWGGFDD